MTIDALAQMGMEHNAWLRMCDSFRVLTGDSVNDEKYRPLMSLVRMWGEELAVLRREQGDDGVTFGRDIRKREAAELAKQGIIASFSD